MGSLLTRLLTRLLTAALHERIHRDRHPGHGESGQSLVIVVLAMVVILAIAALGIDVSARWQAQHQAQAAADAGALAGAQALNTSTTAANTDAVAYAVGGTTSETVNGHAQVIGGTDPGGFATAMEPSATTVKVTVTKDAPLFFGSIFGLNKTVSASATASRVSGPVAPYGLFANATSCSAISFSGHVNGATGIHSNGGISTNGNVPLTDTSNSTYSNSNCTNGPSNATLTSTQSWPLDYGSGTLYSDLTAACTYTSTNPPSGSGWSFSGSGNSHWTFSGSQIGTGVYCNPSGTITLANNVTSVATQGQGVTLYASTVSLGNGNVLYGDFQDPANQYLVAYQTGSTSLDIPGNGTIYGNLFYPQASVTFEGTAALDGFLEADTLTFKGTVTATGPTDTSPGNSGCCSLTQ